MQTIVKLSSENVKRIKAVTLTPTGAVVTIGGRNGQGKTSLMDSISMALGGKGEVPSEPIRKGEKRAIIILETQEIIVTRKFTAAGSTLEVTNREGLKFPSPQAVLDKLCSAITFDPLAFIRSDKKSQLVQLLLLLGLNPADLDARRKATFADRAAKNKAVKEQEALVIALPMTGPPAVVMSDLLKALDDAQAHNLEIIKAEESLEDSTTKVRAAISLKQLTDEDVANFEKLLEQAKSKAENAASVLQSSLNEQSKARKHFESMIEVDTNPIREKIASAEAVNKEAARVELRKTELVKLAALTKESEALTDQLAKLDDEKLAMIAEAKFPVEGLGFDESGVLFNGLPLDQASSAEQLKVGLAVACSMNPELRVMLIRDGSLLDDDSLKIVGQMAVAHGAQVWIERVGNDGKCSVVIEDGEAQEQPPVEVAPAAAPLGY